MKYCWLASFLFFSCVEKKNVFNGILLNVPDEETMGQYFLENFELEDLVPIETTNEFLLSGIKNDVIYYKEKIIIADQVTSSIFVVDAFTGKIETKICRRGRGPGESNIILSIAFDEINEKIIVYNDYKKLIFFGLDGSFIKEERAENFLYDNIIYDNGKIIFYDAGKGHGCLPYLISIYDIQDKTWKNIGNDKIVEFDLRQHGRLLIKSKNIWFAPVLDLGLYMLNDDEISVPYMLDKKPLDDNLRHESVYNPDPFVFIKEVGNRNIMYCVHSIRETEKFIIFKTNKFGFFMLNKNESKLCWVSLYDERLGIELWTYYPHNGDDNRIMFVVDADKWLERTTQNADKIPEHLKEKIINIKVNEESNPILVFYKEKYSMEIRYDKQ